MSGGGGKDVTQGSGFLDTINGGPVTTISRAALGDVPLGGSPGERLEYVSTSTRAGVGFDTILDFARAMATASILKGLDADATACGRPGVPISRARVPSAAAGRASVSAQSEQRRDDLTSRYDRRRLPDFFVKLVVRAFRGVGLRALMRIVSESKFAFKARDSCVVSLMNWMGERCPLFVGCRRWAYVVGRRPSGKGAQCIRSGNIHRDGPF